MTDHLVQVNSVTGEWKRSSSRRWPTNAMIDSRGERIVENAFNEAVLAWCDHVHSEMETLLFAKKCCPRLDFRWKWEENITKTRGVYHVSYSTRWYRDLGGDGFPNCFGFTIRKPSIKHCYRETRSRYLATTRVLCRTVYISTIEIKENELKTLYPMALTTCSLREGLPCWTQHVFLVHFTVYWCNCKWTVTGTRKEANWHRSRAQCGCSTAGAPLPAASFLASPNQTVDPLLV